MKNHYLLILTFFLSLLSFAGTDTEKDKKSTAKETVTAPVAPPVAISSR